MKTLFRAVLLAILWLFTTTEFSTAGLIVQPPKKEEKKPEPPKPDPKKLAEALPIAVAVKHCLVLEGSVTDAVKLINSYNYQPDLDNLPEDMSQAEREKVMLYMMGQADIADFGFIIPETWKTAPRNSRIKFNSLVTLRIDEVLGFKQGSYPFHDNCKGKVIGEIEKDKQHFEHVKISMPLVFDTNEAILTYLLYKQENYNWQIEDLLINDVGVGNYLGKGLPQKISLQGLDVTIKEICKKSSFSTLQCN